MGGRGGEWRGWGREEGADGRQRGERRGSRRWGSARLLLPSRGILMSECEPPTPQKERTGVASDFSISTSRLAAFSPMLSFCLQSRGRRRVSPKPAHPLRAAQGPVEGPTVWWKARRRFSRRLEEVGESSIDRLGRLGGIRGRFEEGSRKVRERFEKGSRKVGSPYACSRLS